MTVFNHGTQSAIIASMFTDNPIYIISSVIFGVLPDAIHLTDKPKDWTNYERAHELTFWKLIIPFYGLHIFEDIFVHKPEGGMNSAYLYAEVITWTLMSPFIYCFIRSLI